MIKLEFNSRKELSLTESTRIFKGENLINSFLLTAANPFIGDKRVDDCDFFLHIVLPDGGYLVYRVYWDENSVPLSSQIPISYDITEKAQPIEVFVEIKCGDTVIGKTNSVEILVFESPDEQNGLTPRAELEETIAFLEDELDAASTLREILEELKGSYDSVTERLEADERGISANTSAAATNASAVVSLTAALNGKLDNTDGVVTTSKLADNSVTGAKIPNYTVEFSKLSSGLQDTINTHSSRIASLEANGSVTTARLSDGAVTTAKIGQYAVINEKIAPGSVTAAKLADNSVTGAKIPNYAVEFSKLSSGLQDTINTHTSKLGSLETATTANTSDISNLNYNMGQAQAAVTRLNSSVSALESSMSSVNSDLSELKALVWFDARLGGYTLPDLNNRLAAALAGA